MPANPNPKKRGYKISMSKKGGYKVVGAETGLVRAKHTTLGKAQAQMRALGAQERKWYQSKDKGGSQKVRAKRKWIKHKVNSNNDHEYS